MCVRKITQKIPIIIVLYESRTSYMQCWLPRYGEYTEQLDLCRDSLKNPRSGSQGKLRSSTNNQARVPLQPRLTDKDAACSLEWRNNGRPWLAVPWEQSLAVETGDTLFQALKQSRLIVYLPEYRHAHSEAGPSKSFPVKSAQAIKSIK